LQAPFAGTGDEASRLVVSNQLLSLLTLRWIIMLLFYFLFAVLKSHNLQRPRAAGAFLQVLGDQPPRYFCN